MDFKHNFKYWNLKSYYMYFTTQSLQFCTTVHNVQLCTTIENVQLCTTNRDQAGNKQGEIQFWNGQTDRQSLQLTVMGKLSWESCHQPSLEICQKHKKSEKGDQIERNSGLTTDRQTEHKCRCWAAPLQLKIQWMKDQMQLSNVVM